MYVRNGELNSPFLDIDNHIYVDCMCNINELQCYLQHATLIPYTHVCSLSDIVTL